MAAAYNHKVVEKKWRGNWEAHPINVNDGKKPKYYCLDMFPYPSGSGLHVGHWRGYVISDVWSRYKLMHGYYVIHPMGWDAFGLPAENYAIKNGVHPRISTASNIANIKRQIQDISAIYDWDMEVNTTDPEFYKWTQWIFVKMFKAGLAYEKEMPINWCPSCKTGLANEEVVNGCCERCHSVVTKKDLKQWMLKITAYADRLLDDLDKLDWPEKVKKMQGDWIGRSYGAEVDFKVDGKDAYPDIYEAIKRPEIAAEEPVRIEMFKKLGYFNTESSGHNSEYVAWFRKRPDLIEKYCTHGTGWNPGAYGYILDEYLGREDTWEKEYQDWLDNGEVDLNKGEEYASNIFNAIFGDHTPYFFNANLKNHNYITNIKQNVCVEVPSIATKCGISVYKQVTMPDNLAILVNNSAMIEDMAVKAAEAGDPNMVFQACLFDPLTSAVCSMDEIQQMVQEMLYKNAEYLSYFKTLDINMERVHETTH